MEEEGKMFVEIAREAGESLKTVSSNWTFEGVFVDECDGIALMKCVFKDGEKNELAFDNICNIYVNGHNLRLSAEEFAYFAKLSELFVAHEREREMIWGKYIKDLSTTPN